MPKGTFIWKIKDLVRNATSVGAYSYETGRWAPARPIGEEGLLYRLRAAWLVLSGRGDVVIWE